MSPQIKEDLILITRERLQLVDLKTHILRGRDKLKNSVRNLLGPEISHRTPKSGLKNVANRNFTET
jgi:hypothetical protein